MYLSSHLHLRNIYIEFCVICSSFITVSFLFTIIQLNAIMGRRPIAGDYKGAQPPYQAENRAKRGCTACTYYDSWIWTEINLQICLAKQSQCPGSVAKRGMTRGEARDGKVGWTDGCCGCVLASRFVEMWIGVERSGVE